MNTNPQHNTQHNTHRNTIAELAVDNAIAAQQANSDTLQRLQATFIMGRVCSKTGAMDETQLSTNDLQLLAVVADGTSYNSAAYALSSQLASHVAAAWINTGPDQLNILRVADPFGFAVYCLQSIFSRKNNPKDHGVATETLCGKYVRNVTLAKLRDKLETRCGDNPFIIANVNKQLTSLISCANVKLLREAVTGSVPQCNSLDAVVANLPLLLNRLPLIEQKLIAKLTKNGMTPTLLRQQREKNGGSSAMAASYSRNSAAAKRKWLKYISDYDRSFAAHIYDTLITSLTADQLQMPRDEQSFTDVTVSPTKLAAIKLQIEKKQGSKVFDDILGEFDLGDIQMDMGL